MKSLHRTSTAQESLNSSAVNSSAVNRRTLLGALWELAVPHYWRLVVRRVVRRVRVPPLHLLQRALLLLSLRRLQWLLLVSLPLRRPLLPRPPLLLLLPVLLPALRLLRALLLPRWLLLSRVLSLSRTRCVAS